MKNKTFNSRAHYLELINKIYLLVEGDKKIKGFWFFIKIKTGFFFHSIYGQNLNSSNDNHKSSSVKYFLKSLLKQPLRLFLHLQILSLEKTLFSKLENKTLMIGYQKHNIKAGMYSIYLHPFLEELNGEIFYLDNLGNNKEIQNYYNLLGRYYSSDFFSFTNLILESELDFIDDLIKSETLINSSKLHTSLLKKINNTPNNIKQKKRFLKTLNPKNLFCYCYYDDQTNDFLYAANELHINTSEYQHSSITNTHFAYSPWEQIDNIRKHFPNEFWVWRNEDAELIKKNFSTPNYIPIVKVVGNQYLEMSVKNKINEAVQNSVLICLQGQWIPDFLENFIQSDTKYNWYIRLHPRYPQDKYKLIELTEKKHSKLFVKEANERELYDVLDDVSVVITSFSGTAIEAEKFEKKVIIFGEEGYNSYEEKIISNTYFFINNSQTLKNIL